MVIRLYPNKFQKMILSSWFGITRCTYNQVVASIREETPSYLYTPKRLDK